MKSEGREDERTSVYGTTRSWSKFGSAFSLPISVLLVFATGGYSFLFLACSIPYFLNILNIMSYPAWLDRDTPPKTVQENKDGCSAVSEENLFERRITSPHLTPSQTTVSADEAKKPGERYGKRLTPLSGIYHALRASLADAVKLPRLRRVLIESMCYEGIFKTAKDYIQPILLAVAVSLSVFPEMSKENKLAVITGIVYFILHLLSGVTSAKAGIFRNKAGGDEKASSLLWLFEALVFLVMGFGMWSRTNGIVIFAFIVLALLQNLWRPVLIGRCAAKCDKNRMATLLSVESQSKSLFICVFAPIVGWSVDYLERTNYDCRFLPIPALGLAVAIIMLLWRRRSTPTLQSTE